MEFSENPLTNAELESYRLNARRFRRPINLGGHLTRRRGQSLEFREFSRYHLGDDIRHVDWRASLRTGGYGSTQAGAGWLVRKFRAEEHFKLVISLDVRETMSYPRIQPTRRSAPGRPANISKLQVARWLAAAIAFVALRSEDEVTFHRLFGRKAKFFPMRGGRGIQQISGGLDEITTDLDIEETPNIEGLDTHLPPASVWLIISDLYFQLDPARKLIERIASAQDGMRWVMLIDLDSWPYERFLLDQPPHIRLIRGPGYSGEEDEPFDGSQLASIDRKIQQHKSRIGDDCQLSSEAIVHWPWPGSREEQAGQLTDQAVFNNFFSERFQNDEHLMNLFKRESWS